MPLLARLAPYCQNSDGRLRLLHNTLYQALQDNDEMESCRERILGEIQTAAALRWRNALQWLSLGEIDPVIRELSEVMAVIRLHEVDPGLLHTVWQFSGIYDGRRLDPGLNRHLRGPPRTRRCCKTTCLPRSPSSPGYVRAGRKRRRHGGQR